MNNRKYQVETSGRKFGKTKLAEARAKHAEESVVQEAIEMTCDNSVRKISTQRLICDGKPRYRVQGAKGLTYSQAYDHIIKKFGRDSGKKGSDGKNIVHMRQAGLTKIKRLNEKHIKVLKFGDEKM
jgi:hypothetical protein